MTAFPYTLDGASDGAIDRQPAKAIGLLVLQSDETIEQDFRRVLPASAALYVSRVPSGLTVTNDTLQQMEHHLPNAAALFPRGLRLDAVGYGCTSGTAQIGQARIAALVGQGVDTAHVSEPVSALIAACDALGVKRLAILSPYIEEVSAVLRGVLAQNGVDTPVFGSFEEATERKVVQISPASVHDAAAALAASGDVDAVFLSCTNLRTFDVIDGLERATGLPVLSSNQVLIWHLARLAGVKLGRDGPGQLLKL